MTAAQPLESHDVTSTKHFIVAVDGPGGSGKSTVARSVARLLGLGYLDTGAMYRAVTALALRRRVDPSDAAAVATLAAEHPVEITLDPDRVHVVIDGQDVTTAVRTREVTAAVSRVSAVPEVRRVLLAQQRAAIMRTPRGVVAEGRDVGTVVAPDADVKIFLTASSAIRAARRAEEWGSSGEQAVAQTRRELEDRDAADAGRTASPLARAADAVVIDTTTLSLDDVIGVVLGYCREAGVPQQ